jgi:hypothetical protein
MPANSLESLGFLSVFKARHQIGSVPKGNIQCRDRRRLDPSMHLVPGTIAQNYSMKQKAPGLCRGLMLKQQDSAYRLTWTLLPPAAGPAMRAPSPLETTLTQSESLSL